MRAQQQVTAAAFAVLAAAWAPFGVASAEESAGAKSRPTVVLEWKRDPQARLGRTAVAAPAVPELPADLRLPPPTTSAARGAVGRAASSDALAAHAQRAADETALEAASVWGFRQYWRAGFARGLDQALNDPGSDSADRAEGFRYGHLDPRALLTGQQIAQESAEDSAARAAAKRVRDQFLDLSRLPQRDSSPAVRAALPAWEGPFAIEPELNDVFVALPLGSAPALSRDGRDALNGWSVDPAALARDGRGRTVYEASWKDPDRAFMAWRERQRSGSAWSRYSSVERERFRSIFTTRFSATLAGLDLRPTYAGWRIGFEDGWRYGDAVREEWAYRKGYAEGFDAGVRAAASIAWPFAFNHAYAAAYGADFARWSTTAQPAVAEVKLLDGNDDGVIEPGERLLLEADLVNYGGAAGTFEVRASGPLLDGDGAATVMLRARSRAALDRALDLHVSAATPNRSHGTVTLSVGDASFDALLYVTHPLSLDANVRVDADYLGGSARIEVLVANASRLDLDAVVRAAPIGRGGGPLPDEPIRVPAGRSVRATFAAKGIPALDLIGGHAQWRLTVARDHGDHGDHGDDDASVVRVREVATDLGRRDLLLYIIGLAREPRPSSEDVAEARGLVLERMRADWARAQGADGNPYKRDVENSSSSTALGDLVRTVQNERGQFENREVFAGLGGDIASLAAELPGAHPLLRKWMKRLAKRLG